MIDTLLSGHLDMVLGFRVDQVQAAYRPASTGNWMLTNFLSSVFGQVFKDILSGYHVFSRRFVKSFPVLSDGFEIEPSRAFMPLSSRCRSLRSKTPYCARAEGSFSELNTWSDGFRISYHPETLRSGKPLRFFTAIGVFLTLVSIGLAIPSLSPISRKASSFGCPPRFCRWAG